MIGIDEAFASKAAWLRSSEKYYNLINVGMVKI